MKCVVQRVLSARVSVAGEEVGAIGQGALVFACVVKGDGPAQVEWLADRLAHLRCFEDEAGKMNLSALDLGLSLLVVSQFTLAADNHKGRRPSFDRAAPPAEARALLEQLVRNLENRGLRVSQGRFGADMRVELVNDGPVTLILDSQRGVASSDLTG
jgi:D-tyrosyl-tRNA(Tyr) deacylase